MFNKLINLLSSKDHSGVKAAKAGEQTDAAYHSYVENLKSPPPIPAADNPQKLYEYGYYWEFFSPDIDLERASYYYLKAASMGNADAMYRLGKYYESNHRQVGTNRTHAFYWYKQAIKHGHKRAVTSYKVMQLRKSKGYRD